jgi:predicted lipid-binding transport protein (Tim44 family)
MFRLASIRALVAVLAAFTALVLIASDADARAGQGGSFGSRGGRTYAPPPVTRTAPNQAAPIERSMTQPARPSTVGAAPGAATGGFFNRPGFLGGMFAGFLGAGLLGLLLGNGFLGGLGGFASILGLLLQVALVVIVARLLWTWWQRRNAYATAGGPSLRQGLEQTRGGAGAGLMQRALPGGAAAAGLGSLDIAITEADYDAFEALLQEVQQAYPAENLTRLRSLVTPEMLSYFAEELAQNASRGLVNEVSGVKLLQGDLAEAWREGDVDYATVAMRYELIDTLVEHATGRVVEGSRDKQEVTELWTFMRSRGGNWILSAIQQA